MHKIAIRRKYTFSYSHILVLIMLLFLLDAGSGNADMLASVQGKDVEAGGEIGRRIHITADNNLFVMDIENDFLNPFRQKDEGGGYIGLGKTIETAARLAAYTHNDSHVQFKDYLIGETLKTQEPDGYIGIVKPDARLWSLWDIHEMSYIINSLVADYQLFGQQRSLDAAQKLADYIINGWMPEPDRIPGGGDITTYMAVTGSEPAMLELYKETGEQRYLDYCTKLRKLQEWDGPIVLGRWGPIQGHAYAYIARCIAQLRLYRMEPQESLLKPTTRALDFIIKQDGLVITGTCGDHECWHDTQEGTINLGETCATAYVIRFMDELLRMEGQAKYGDIMERAIYNALFAAQSPDGRKIRYYTPFDGKRSYFDGDTYCCPCNYRRIIAELPNMIYYRKDDGIAVNLYAPSKALITDIGGTKVQIEQKTDYPNTGQVLIEVTPSKPANFELLLRIPRWAQETTVAVNGEILSKKTVQGEFFSITRKWKNGDQVRLHMPMQWRFIKGRKAQAGRVAMMYGPQVFTLDLNSNDQLKDTDLRLITIDTDSIEGPFEDESVHPNGLGCRIKAWGPGVWYPFSKQDLELTLTEFAAPGGEAAYFKVPNPNLENLVDDELIEVPKNH